MINSLFFLGFGFLVALLTTPWVIRLSERGIGRGYAGRIPQTHAKLIPRLGGAPIMLAISLGLTVVILPAAGKRHEVVSGASGQFADVRLGALG